MRICVAELAVHIHLVMLCINRLQAQMLSVIWAVTENSLFGKLLNKRSTRCEQNVCCMYKNERLLYPDYIIILYVIY